MRCRCDIICECVCVRTDLCVCVCVLVCGSEGVMRVICVFITLCNYLNVCVSMYTFV